MYQFIELGIYRRNAFEHEPFEENSIVYDLIIKGELVATFADYSSALATLRKRLA
jgi:hypothetical protein